jgi:hypothetical protein
VPSRDVERGVVDSLRTYGIAIVPFAELIGDKRLWDELSAGAASFAEEAAGRVPGVDRPTVKNDYLIRRSGGMTAAVDGKPVASFPARDPLIRFGASDPILNVANAYRGLRTKLVDFDTWYTVPFAATDERVGSQRWHRDPEDQHVLKVFVYFTDVDEEAGPFQYVKGSAEGGRYGDLSPWSRAMSSRLRWTRRRRLYPPEKWVDKRVDASDVATVTGPAGTVVRCDTSGFHRGGFAKRRPRVPSYHTYVSPGARERSFGVDWDAADGELSKQGRFALE